MGIFFIIEASFVNKLLNVIYWVDSRIVNSLLDHIFNL